MAAPTNDLPNLFKFATKELSQDAFFCWLLSWSDNKYRATDEALHKRAIDLMNELLNTCNIEPPQMYEDLKVRRPYPDWETGKKIDILVLFSDIALVIEDKKHAGPHANQLECYHDIVKRRFPERKAALVYLKTGKLSKKEEESVNQSDFHLFRHQDLLPLLEQDENQGIKSEIFANYLCWLRLFVAQTRSRKRLYSVAGLEQLKHDEDQILLVMRTNNITYDKKVTPSMLKSLPFKGKQFMPSWYGELFDPQIHARTHTTIHKTCQILAEKQPPLLCKEEIGKGKRKVNWYYLPGPAPDAPPAGSFPHAGQTQTPNSLGA